jgi:hypothetical protein
MPMLAVAGCCYCSAAGCCWLLLLIAGCWCCRPRAARARSPGGIFEEFLDFFLKKKMKTKVSNFFGGTLSRIVIDHKNRPPPPAAPPSK